MKRTLSFSDWWAFKQCSLEYLLRVLRVRGKSFNKFEAIGNATHVLAADGDTSSSRRYVERQLRRLPEDEREEAAARIEELTRTAEEMAEEDESTDRVPEEKYYCEAPVEGWQLVAKADEVSWLQENDSEILQVTDIKTAEKCKKRHKEQLFFFALVISRALNYRGPIKLVVRLLGSGTEEVFWYSHAKTSETLAAVREDIMRIERWWKGRGFKARPAPWRCGGCKFAAICPHAASDDGGSRQAAADSRRLVPMTVDEARQLAKTA